MTKQKKKKSTIGKNTLITKDWFSGDKTSQLTRAQNSRLKLEKRLDEIAKRPSKGPQVKLRKSEEPK